MDDLLAENSFTPRQAPASTGAGRAVHRRSSTRFHATWADRLRELHPALVRTRPTAPVSAADDTIDDFVDTLDRTILILVKNDRQNPIYTLYFGDEIPSG